MMAIPRPLSSPPHPLSLSDPPPPPPPTSPPANGRLPHSPAIPGCSASRTSSSPAVVPRRGVPPAPTIHMAMAAGHADCSLQSFRLYETLSNFYMIGRGKSRTVWRVLKIDRSEPSELTIHEDPAVYSESECRDFLTRVHEGNRSTGGLKFITNCYGIIGFVKFLGPYYMLIITKRRKIGSICGHVVYGISKSEMIMIPNPTVRSNMTYSKDENRYKKLLGTVDLTKDFFFSYSYNIMRSFQKNFCSGGTGQVPYETMFVWNEFLTRGIRNHLKNTTWTVALVFGFFKQTDLSVSGKDFKLTLIARRSRLFAGPRYLKRGVNEKGRVANDVETEQIVSEDSSAQISSIVQNRGSIPLFWSQETSWLNIKPDIILHKKDNFFDATRLHFDNLVQRYGNPIIILNLIKTREKKPRESILRREFAKAIAFLNKDLPEERQLRFIHWDIHKHTRRKSTNVLALLDEVTSQALDLTGYFYYQVTSTMGPESCLHSPRLMKDNAGGWSCNKHGDGTDKGDISEYGSQQENMSSGISASESAKERIGSDSSSLANLPILQKGVLRTNCIDCLDRTNLAQYAFGVAALGHQLHALGFIDVPKIDLDNPLTNDLMHLYEIMGDTLALQYGGSAAHKKIFSERRGQWKAATQYQELFSTMQRYYSNTYMDAEKQDSINVFLGHFQPQQGKPTLWELDSDQYYSVGMHDHALAHKNARSSIKRSLSDGHIMRQSSTPERTCLEDANDVSDPLSEMGTENSISDSRQLSENGRHSFSNEHGFDESNYSNFLDLDWLSSCGNSLEEESFDRAATINSLIENHSTENVIDGITADSTPSVSEMGVNETDSELSYGTSRNYDVLHELPDTFAHWVAHGSIFCHCR